ncbi:hypothetical protein LR48_Vigan499s005400 [Vigna angularis]|uniref:Uncharacterized protein n=2 Tax=Phaseolus angularis TaxID=3914 RepID=A0A0L9TBW2_PHAAN|nr:uncharacterized protein LOC108321265 [Vigna angularis]XP_017408453.1 uncharacterized protein LOC108321265 [Vigna angularis]KAG2376223.1 uncharacterized protein HKW66_Vig0156230 [Vigna angularis]KOM28110.1 hypothetical protein LR48_Vigan499s005400 [Vigna angularis]BAT99937.1 hypothetical protein VIGAN_10148200 [Vigna angularis var. angularis]
MKQRKEKSEGDVYESMAEVVPRSPVPPPPPPPLPKFSKRKPEESVTNREIARFWRQKRIEEEDHLLAAIKAAARLRARNLTEQDYQRFELSLKTDNDYAETEKESVKWKAETNVHSKTLAKDQEVRVGIKDWWTKSKYAYLNQPAIDSMDLPKKRSSTYVPNFLSYQPKPLYASAIGVF